MLWACPCGSAYSVGAPRCPECGLNCDAAIERDDMARVTVHGGMTDRLRPELSEGDDVSPGSSSSASQPKPETPPKLSEQVDRKPVGKTESLSAQRRRGTASTAGSADASTIDAD